MAASIGAPPGKEHFMGRSQGYSLRSACKAIPAYFCKASIGIALCSAPLEHLFTLSPVSLSCPRHFKGGLLRMAEGSASRVRPHLPLFFSVFHGCVMVATVFVSGVYVLSLIGQRQRKYQRTPLGNGLPLPFFGCALYSGLLDAQGARAAPKSTKNLCNEGNFYVAFTPVRSWPAGQRMAGVRLR